MTRARTILALVVGLLVAGALYVLAAPLDCEPVIEVISSAPGTEIQGSPEAGPQVCNRLVLPDFEGSSTLPRMLALAAAAIAGYGVSSLVSKRSAPPPGEDKP